MDKIYQLPDGSDITINQQRFRCPEALFQPQLIGKNIQGIHELTYHAIMKCDPDCLKELSSNIVLSGGSTNYPGMIERLTKEVSILYSSMDYRPVPFALRSLHLQNAVSPSGSVVLSSQVSTPFKRCGLVRATTRNGESI